MLHSRILRYLDEVARAGSIRKAAERLNVSATAVNKQILLLEEELGTPIFHRLPRSLRLTAAGEVVIDHVRQTLKQFSLTKFRLEDLKGLRSGEVTIATMNGLASGIVPRIVADFCTRHTKIKINSRIMFIHDIVKAISDGDADIALAYALPPDPRLQMIDSYAAPLGAVVHKSHPLVARPSISIDECVGHPLIFADDAMAMHRIVGDAFARLDVHIEPRFQSNSIEFMKFLAVTGEGIAFLSPFDVALEVAQGSLVHIPIRDHLMTQNTLMLVQRAKRSLDIGTSLMIEDIRAYLDALR